MLSQPTHQLLPLRNPTSVATRSPRCYRNLTRNEEGLGLFFLFIRRKSRGSCFLNGTGISSVLRFLSVQSEGKLSGQA